HVQGDHGASSGGGRTDRGGVILRHPLVQPQSQRRELEAELGGRGELGFGEGGDQPQVLVAGGGGLLRVAGVLPQVRQRHLESPAHELAGGTQCVFDSRASDKPAYHVPGDRSFGRQALNPGRTGRGEQHRTEHVLSVSLVTAVVAIVYGCHVDFDAYAHTAVRLVNAPLATTEDLRALFPPDGWEQAELTDRDLAVFRRAQRRLRGIFALGTAGRDAEVVAELNALLRAFPVEPRISGHDASDWHMHI